MTSKASTPEVENVPQIISIDDNKNQFENMDSHAEDFQATEQDPCIPTSNNVKINKNSMGNSRDSLENKKDYLENEKDEKIMVPENIEYPLPNSKTPKKKLSFVKKFNRRSDGNKKFSLSNSEFEARIRKKLGLTHHGFVVGILLLCVSVLALLVILILGITWPRTPHGQLFPVCTKSACLRASAMMLPKFDRTKLPCEDFYGFLCGGWSRKHSKPPPTRPRWGLEQELDLRLSETIRGVISTLPHPTRVNSLTWKIKNFYDSCMSLDNIETDKERPLKKIIQELGGWQVLREFSVLSWDFSQVLVKLQSEHGVTPFFQVSVTPDPRNADKNILQLSPSGLGLPHKSYYYREKDDRMSSSYRRYMKDVVQMLGANSIDANSFSEDMFYFERRIAEITPSISDLEDIRKHEIHSISMLKTIAPSIPLHEIVNAMFPKADIDDGTEVLVTSTFYLSKISNILATIDRSALNNYVIWTFVKEYLPYLSQNFMDIYYVYNREMTGATEPLERWEFCIKTLEKYMDFGLAAQLERSEPILLREENEKIVGAIFDAIREAVRESVTKSQWIELELYKHFINKLDGMALQVGFPAPFLEYSYLEEYYSRLHVQKNDFFRNIQYGVSFLQEERTRRYVSPKEEYKWLSTMSSELEVKWVPTANKITIPQRLLREPYYEPDYPVAVLYGSLGVEIAREMITSLLRYSALYSSNGTLINDNGLVANLSLNSVNHQINCLNDFYVENAIGDVQIANRTSLSTFINISAVKQALKALKKVSRTAEHIHQPGLEDYENDSLFYITYGQTLCVAQTTQQADRENTTSNSLNNRNILKTVTFQLKSFAESFQCSAPSKICKHIL